MERYIARCQWIHHFWGEYSCELVVQFTSESMGDKCIPDLQCDDVKWHKHSSYPTCWRAFAVRGGPAALKSRLHAMGAPPDCDDLYHSCDVGTIFWLGLPTAYRLKGRKSDHRELCSDDKCPHNFDRRAGGAGVWKVRKHYHTGPVTP